MVKPVPRSNATPVPVPTEAAPDTAIWFAVVASHASPSVLPSARFNADRFKVLPMLAGK